jgi:hypothetical protein
VWLLALQVFLSVKGVYLQAEVQGQTINWLVPWKFSQQLPRDVDYRVMLTFLEFHEVCAQMPPAYCLLPAATVCCYSLLLSSVLYRCPSRHLSNSLISAQSTVSLQVLMKFVLFKLYHTIGLTYPPVIKAETAAKGGLLSAVQLTKASASAAPSAAAGPAVPAATPAVPASASSAVKQQQAATEKRLKSLQAVLKGAAAAAPAEGEHCDYLPAAMLSECRCGRNALGLRALRAPCLAVIVLMSLILLLLLLL